MKLLPIIAALLLAAPTPARADEEPVLDMTWLEAASSIPTEQPQTGLHFGLRLLAMPVVGLQCAPYGNLAKVTYRGGCAQQSERPGVIVECGTDSTEGCGDVLLEFHTGNPQQPITVFSPAWQMCLGQDYVWLDASFPPYVCWWG